MDRKITRANALLGAAALLCLLVTSVAVAGGANGSGGPEATASASVKKKLKKLKKRVKGLEQADASLEQRLAAVEGEQGSPRPPSGPARGDLTGNYPNPLIANNAVSSAQVANGTLRLEDVTTLELPLVANFSNITAETCQLNMFAGPDVSAVEFGDRPVLVPPTFLPSGLVVSPRQTPQDGQINLDVCNVTNADINPPELTYNILIFRPG